MYHAFKLHIYEVKASHYSVQVQKLIRVIFLVAKKPALSDVHRYRRKMPIATASGGGVVNLSHDLFLFYQKIKDFFFVCSETGFIMGLSRKLNYL